MLSDPDGHEAIVGHDLWYKGRGRSMNRSSSVFSLALAPARVARAEHFLKELKCDGNVLDHERVILGQDSVRVGL